jgi:hypothetical protein
MPSEFPAREVTNLVALFQKAHSKVVSLARVDDQIAAMVVQHERLQEEVRAVQNEINQEFERALKFNQAPAKLPPTVGGTPPPVASPPPVTPPPPAAQPAHAPAAIGPVNGEHTKDELTFGGEVIPLARA